MNHSQSRVRKAWLSASALDLTGSSIRITLAPAPVTPEPTPAALTPPPLVVAQSLTLCWAGSSGTRPSTILRTLRLNFSARPWLYAPMMTRQVGSRSILQAAYRTVFCSVLPCRGGQNVIR